MTDNMSGYGLYSPWTFDFAKDTLALLIVKEYYGLESNETNLAKQEWKTTVYKSFNIYDYSGEYEEVEEILNSDRLEYVNLVSTAENIVKNQIYNEVFIDGEVKKFFNMNCLWAPSFKEPNKFKTVQAGNALSTIIAYFGPDSKEAQTAEEEYLQITKRYKH
ncbi:MAG: hypothetical protein ACP5N2_02235 [Candidatus Nanoarchaeia archaeon]